MSEKVVPLRSWNETRDAKLDALVREWRAEALMLQQAARNEAIKRLREICEERSVRLIDAARMAQRYGWL